MRNWMCGFRPHFRGIVTVLSTSPHQGPKSNKRPSPDSDAHLLSPPGSLCYPQLCFVKLLQLCTSPSGSPLGRTESPSGTAALLALGTELSWRGTRTLCCFPGCCDGTKQTGSPNLGESKLHSFTLPHCVVSWLSAFPCPHRNLSSNPLHRCCTMGAFMTVLAPESLGEQCRGAGRGFCGGGGGGRLKLRTPPQAAGEQRQIARVKAGC